MGQCITLVNDSCVSIANVSVSIANVSASDDTVQLFSLDKQIHSAKIVRVYDGDTCFAVFKLHNELVKFKIRMEGYDSPEMKPSLENKNREKEKKDAQKAKEELEKLVLNKVITLHCGKWDKYGRLLGTIYIADYINVNELMIKNGFGYVYDGGTKKTFDVVGG
jgi:endonuclease YncB( thermonuclease family)